MMNGMEYGGRMNGANINPYMPMNGMGMGMNMSMPNSNSYGINNAPTNSIPQNNGIIWVQGIEGAKAWQLSPNSNVMLMDSENEGRFYIKVSDNVGMCNLRIFDYTEVTNNAISAQSADMSKYVTHDELKELLSHMNKGGGVNGEQLIPTNEPNGTGNNTGHGTTK